MTDTDSNLERLFRELGDIERRRPSSRRSADVQGAWLEEVQAKQDEIITALSSPSPEPDTHG